ncbi:MAG: hypothetical protein GX125_09685 [Bacteroidales bacterium]|jgi:hypothetical protein|nr:hypothetical protein [Bacteroidales bacterium]
MKKINALLTIASLLAILPIGCKEDTVSVDRVQKKGMLSLSVAKPSRDDASVTRISVSESSQNSRQLQYKWIAGETVHLCFVQGNTKATTFTTVQSVSADGRTAVFSPVTIPQEINDGDFTVVGSNDLQETGGGMDPDNPTHIYLPVSDWYWTSLESISDNGMRFYFQSQVTGYQRGDAVSVFSQFIPLGYFLCVKIKNISDNPIHINELSLISADGTEWVGNSEENFENHPAVFDALAEVYLNKDASDARRFNVDNELSANEIAQVDAWSIPLDQEADVRLTMDYGADHTIATSTNLKHIPILQVNKRYFLYGLWEDGNKLSFTDRDFTPQTDNYRVTFTTDKSVGVEIGIGVDAAEAYRPGVWIDLNNNGVKDQGEAITNFGLDSWELGYYAIQNQTITIYGKLTKLSLNACGLTSLNVSEEPFLTRLLCGSNSLNALDISNNKELSLLYCAYNKLSALDLSGQTKLVSLSCPNNLFTQLDVTDCALLTYLQCENNRLTGLDVSQNPELYRLWTNNNKLTWLNVAATTKLAELRCSENTLTTLDVTNNPELKEFYCDKNQLTAMNLASNLKLQDFRCQNNLLTELDLSNNTLLKDLRCSNNDLTSLDLSNKAELVYLYCDNNDLTSLVLSDSPKLTTLYCHSDTLTALDLTANTLLTRVDCYTNYITGDAMTALMNSLPDRTGKTAGKLILIDNKRLPYSYHADGNSATVSDVNIATGKNWLVYDNNMGWPIQFPGY